MNFFPFQFQNVIVFTKFLIYIYFRTKYSCRFVGQEKQTKKNLNFPFFSIHLYRDDDHGLATWIGWQEKIATSAYWKNAAAPGRTICCWPMNAALVEIVTSEG